MLSNNHNSCAFAEQIVSYIYDEATAKERGNFETHLLDCLPCADEIAGFGLIRSSIGEWRKAEVFVSDAPALKIPEFQTANLAQTFESEKSSWLDGLRNLFSPAWAGGFAALIVCVGLIWFFSGNSKQNIVANATTQIAPVITNKSDEINPQPQEEKAVVLPQEEDLKIAPKSVKAVEKRIIAPKQNPVRASNIPPKSKSVTPKTNNQMAVNKNNKTNNSQKTPTLSEVDGDEDNSLRLAELFDEIDSK